MQTNDNDKNSADSVAQNLKTQAQLKALSVAQTVALGHDIRTLRSACKASLSELARAIGRSTGWLSQIERGQTIPTLDDLHRISFALKVPTSLFFGPYEEEVERDTERGIVVRKGSRRTFGHKSHGVTEELLSPSGDTKLQMLRVVLFPGNDIDIVGHCSAQEIVVVISGKLSVRVGDIQYVLSADDTQVFDNATHNCANPSDQPVVFHRIITPPSY